MDEIPIFSGEKTDFETWLTCGQFLTIIENHAKENDFTEEQLKELCLFKSSENALELLQKHHDQSWTDLKNLMFSEFPVKLSIRDKVELRKNLQQQDSESIDEFYQRCIQVQYLVSDDNRDVGFEREVLLHFLVGLAPFIRDLVLASKCSNTNEYVKEAKKYVQIVKEEPMEANIKIETEILDEDFDVKSDFDSFGEYDYDWGDHQDEEFEQAEWICDECGKSFSGNQKLKMHSQTFHKKCAKCDKKFDDKDLHYEMWHGKIECKHCDYSCRSKGLLKSHMRENHDSDLEVTSNNWTCEECDKTYSDRQSYKTHCQWMHNKCAKCNKAFVDKVKHYKISHNLVICNHCEYTSKNNTVMTKHIEEKHKNLGKCRICSEEFDSKDIRLEHENKVHSHLKQSCDKCDETCLTIRHLASHIAYKHCSKNEEGKTVCLYCTTFNRKRPLDLSYHILNKHFNQPNYKCSQCDRGFDTKHDFENHIKITHSEERESFHCDKCPKSFKSLLGMNLHVKNIHIGQTEAECKECDKTFKNERYLKNHQRLMHSGERTKWICDDCGKSFSSKQHFKNHCLRVHVDAEEKAKHMHVCTHPGCENSFITKDHLSRHYKRVHLKEKHYQCALCPKSFFAKKMFEEHTNGVHLNLKPFQCEMCEFATAYSATFLEHKKVAHGNQRFDCPHCPHTAKYKNNLDKHINNVHKNLFMANEKNLM